MRFHIPGALREFAGGRSQVEVEHPPATLNAALAALWSVCPGLRDRVVTEQGEIRSHVNIFVGEENIRYTGGLATRVTAEAVISIVPAVSGGSRPVAFHAAEHKKVRGLIFRGMRRRIQR